MHQEATEAHIVALSRRSAQSFSGSGLRPSFVFGVEPPASSRRVWGCACHRACAECTCWHNCLGLRWNLRGEALEFGGLVSSSNQMTSDAAGGIEPISVTTSHPLIWTSVLRPEGWPGAGGREILDSMSGAT